MWMILKHPIDLVPEWGEGGKKEKVKALWLVGGILLFHVLSV